MRLRTSLLALPLLALLGCPADDEDGSSTSNASNTESAEGGMTDQADDGEASDDGQDTGSTSEVGSSSSSGGEEESGSSSGGTTTTGSSAADTWENWALPAYFDVYCNQCHPAAGQSTRDFSDYDTVGDNFEHIRCGTAPTKIEGCDGHIEPGHLPIGPGPYPSDDERWRLVDWLDAGMPRD